MILHVTRQTCWPVMSPHSLFVLVNPLYFLFLWLSASVDNYIPFTEKQLLIITYVAFLGTAAVAGFWLAQLFILMVLCRPQWYSRWIENVYCMMKKRVCEGNSGTVCLNTPERRCLLISICFFFHDRRLSSRFGLNSVARKTRWIMEGIALFQPPDMREPEIVENWLEQWNNLSSLCSQIAW